MEKILLNEHGGWGLNPALQVSASGLVKMKSHSFPSPIIFLMSRLLFIYLNEFKINNDKKRYDYKHVIEWIFKRYVWSFVHITYNSFYYNYIYTDLLYLSKHEDILQISAMTIPSFVVLALACLWISSTNALEILWVGESVHEYLGNEISL